MEYDCAIVLAHDLNKDNTLEKQTKNRVKLSIEQYKVGRVGKLIMSGGHKDLGVGYGVSEAEVMIKYAAERGVKPTDLIGEDVSLESVGELIFCKLGVIDPRRFRKILVISNNYHLVRLGQIARIVFDANYSVDFAGVKDDFDEEQVRTVNEKERKSIETFLRTFGQIKPGDSNVFLETLLREHEVYNKNPEEFRKRLEVLIRKNS